MYRGSADLGFIKVGFFLGGAKFESEKFGNGIKTGFKEEGNDDGPDNLFNENLDG